MVFLFSAKNKDQDLPRAALAMQHEEGVARPILLGFYCAHFATGRFRPGHPCSSGARIALIVVSGDSRLGLSPRLHDKQPP